MASMKPLTPTPGEPVSMKLTSIRVPESVWDLAMERSAAEGVGRTALLTYLLEGYAYGHYTLPKLAYPQRQGYEKDGEEG